MPPARNERVKFNVDFLSVSINQSNGLLKTVRLPVLFGSLVIFPSKDGQITSSRALFVRKEFIQRLRANRQDSYLSLEFMQQSVLCAHRCNVSAFRDGFCDNLSDYIIFRRRSTGGDFSVPQHITLIRSDTEFFVSRYKTGRCLIHLSDLIIQTRA